MEADKNPDPSKEALNHRKKLKATIEQLKTMLTIDAADRANMINAIKENKGKLAKHLCIGLVVYFIGLCGLSFLWILVGIFLVLKKEQAKFSEQQLRPIRSYLDFYF